MGTFTIACEYQHHDKPPTAKVDACVGDIAEGFGSDLPAILGLTSIQSKRANLIFQGGNGRIMSRLAHVRVASSKGPVGSAA
eukprot:2106905-Pyramimonas_sp.AAC.1